MSDILQFPSAEEDDNKELEKSEESDAPLAPIIQHPAQLPRTTVWTGEVVNRVLGGGYLFS